MKRQKHFMMFKVTESIQDYPRFDESINLTADDKIVYVTVL